MFAAMYIKFTDQSTYLDVVQLDNSFTEIPDTRVVVLTSQASVKTRDSEDALVITGVHLPAAVIKYGLLVDATNTPFASLQSAYAYVATLFTKYLNGIPSTGGGGGGGGDASALNQQAQINQQKSTQAGSVWGAGTDELTTAQWLAKLNVKDSGICWGKDIAFDTLVLMSISRTEAGVPAISYYLQDGTPYLPSNPTDVVPLEALILSGQTDAQQITQIVDAEGDSLMVTPEGYVTSQEVDFDYLVQSGQNTALSALQLSGFGTVGTANGQPIASWISGAGVYYGFTLTANTNMGIVSSSANDTAAGTGIRTVFVEGIREVSGTWVTQSEVVTLNGTTAVPLGNQYIRINRMAAITAGTLGVSAGTVTIFAGGNPANVMRQISTGETAPYGMIYSVPSDKEAYLASITMSNQSGDTTRFRFKRIDRSIANPAVQSTSSLRISQAALDSQLKYSKIGSKCDFWIEGQASTGTDQISVEAIIYFRQI